MTRLSERVLVSESSEQYEDAITGAMVKMKNKIAPDCQVHRSAAKCEELRDWYVEDVNGVMSAGEQMVMLEVTFQLAGSDL